MIYCPACGLFTSNGYCPHGSVDAVLERQAVAREKRQRGKKKGCT